MFRNHTSRIAAIITLLSTVALPQTGLAASYLDTVQKNAKTTYTASLMDITQKESARTTRTLDWRQPSLELYFDLPPSERTSEIVLTLSADPLTRVAPNAPLQVQFNNGKPVPVLSNGRGFEARLPLDAAQSRGKRNVIRISYPTPAGAECVTPAHGAWSVDLAQSTLRMGGRVKNRNMSISEVTAYLKQPALSPKTVGLIARGPDGTDMQALAAQAIALRTPGVPKFSVVKRGTDFNVVMVKRDRLFDITDDPMILNSKGPRIFVPRGRPTELIFTGDTDAEILDMLEIFATRKLPNTRRPISSLGELNLQNRLDSGTLKIDGKTRLMDLAVTSPDAASGALTYEFGVADPVATGGEVLLRLSTTDDMAKNSRLRVTLNGKTLGAAKLDRKRKSVAFDIKAGALNATSNILTLMPDLEANPGYICPTANVFAPGFSIGDSSRLTMTSAAPSPVTELSQLTSTGGLFAQSESYIALPRETRDFQASLRILGRMAKSAGHGLTYADYTRKPVTAKDKHVLVIGPSDMIKSHLTGAPKAFREALSGQSSTGDNLLQASYERSASFGSDDSMLKYAAAQSAPRKIRRGGIAALYSAGNGNLTGVISTAPGSSFVQASQTLVQPGHWNAMQGGVARWTSSSVVMAQTAQSDAGIKKPKAQGEFELPDIGLLGFDDLDLHWPNINWPEINWPEFDMPQVGLPNLKWPSFKSAETTAPAHPISKPAILPVDIKRGNSVPKVKTTEFKKIEQAKEIVKVADVTPRLKPTFKRPEISTAGLRGPFKYSTEKKTGLASFEDIRRGTKSKWFATKRWVKAKTKAVSDNKVMNDVARATDRLQDQVKPAGRSMKTSLKDKMPGKGLVQVGDRTMSVYGLMLMLAFGLVLLLMSLAGPKSRLGRR